MSALGGDDYEGLLFAQVITMLVFVVHVGKLRRITFNSNSGNLEFIYEPYPTPSQGISIQKCSLGSHLLLLSSNSVDLLAQHCLKGCQQCNIFWSPVLHLVDWFCFRPCKLGHSRVDQDVGYPGV
jgi:hypothetical protein